MEIGRTLREARNRRGLSIQEVEEATKIRTRYLQALEQDDFETIPGSTFVVGFLRTYATYLGLDADALVEEYLREYDPDFLEPHRLPTSQHAARRSKKAARNPGYVILAIIAIVVIAVLAWVGVGTRSSTRSSSFDSAPVVLTACCSLADGWQGCAVLLGTLPGPEVL